MRTPTICTELLTQCSMVNIMLQRLGWTWRRGLTFSESEMLKSYCQTPRLQKEGVDNSSAQDTEDPGRPWSHTTAPPVTAHQKKSCKLRHLVPRQQTMSKLNCGPQCRMLATGLMYWFTFANLIEGGVGIPKTCCERIPAMLRKGDLYRFVWSCSVEKNLAGNRIFFQQ